MTCGIAGVFCPIPDHNSPIRAHRCYDIWVLRLVPGFVDLSLMVDLLDNVKLHFHISPLLSHAAAMTADFFPFFVIICYIRSDRFWKLNMSDLKIVLSLARGVSTNQESMGGIIFVGNPTVVSVV